MGSNLQQHLRDILTYDDSKLDIALNYFLLVFSFIIFCFLNWWTQKTTRPRSANCLTMPLHRHFMFMPCLYEIELFVFQVGLCLAVGCVGISIIWSANVGIILIIAKYERLLQERIFTPKGCVQYCSLLPFTSTWMYYALTEPFLTTLAHICALLLGLLIGHMHMQYIQNIGYTDVSTHAQPLVPG